MTLQDIVQEFKESTCGEIRLDSSGFERYIVHVPFYFDDGDHYVVLLKRENQNWILSDEGHTLTHLSYELRDKEYEKGNRQKIIDDVLVSHQISNIEGELKLIVPQNRYGDALFTYIQAITKITDVSFLNREIIKTTFQEDFRTLVTEKSSELNIPNVSYNYVHPTHDTRGIYPVDIKLNGITQKPIFLFAIDSDDKCQSATIVLHQWKDWGERFYSIAVFNDWMGITKTHLYRISDVLNKQFVSLDKAKELLKRELEDNLVTQS